MQEDLLGARHSNTQRTRCSKSTWSTAFNLNTQRTRCIKYYHQVLLLGALHYLVQLGEIYLVRCIQILCILGAWLAIYPSKQYISIKYFHQAILLSAANLLGALHYHQVLLLGSANSSLRETANCMEFFGENLNVGTRVPYFILRVT